jgi:hypothetical protein
LTSSTAFSDLAGTGANRSFRPLQAGTTIWLTRGGDGNLFLGRGAQCRMLSRTQGGTTLLTRRPKSFLFTQRRGDALCTMADLRILFVEAGAKVRLLTDSTRAKTTAFYTSLEAHTGGPAAEFRLRFYPRKSFAVAAHRGKLLARLSTGDPRTVSEGRELGIALRQDGTISWVTDEPAKFTAAELATFEQQFRLPDLIPIITDFRPSCVPGSCSTTVVFTVRNIGKVVSPPFRTRLELDPRFSVIRTVWVPETPMPWSRRSCV